MNSCLILLTNYYPFYKGEEYLETEIKYLAKEFSHIYIVATMVDPNMQLTRKVPQNVTVLPTRVSHSIFSKFKMVFSKYRQIRKDSTSVENIRADAGSSILRRGYSYYFESRAMFIYDIIKELLTEYNFSGYDQFVIYSYWFYITARIAIDLNNKFFRQQKTYTLTRAHGYDINVSASPVKFLPARKFLLSELDNIYPCSQNGVNYLKTSYPEYSSKISVRRLGTERNSKRNTANRTPFHIVSCSTVRKLKRLDLIVDALSVLEDRGIQIVWTHLGDGPEFNKIRRLVSKKLKKSEVNLVGFLKNKDVLQWYEKNEASLFINVSSSEGVPVAIMEALSMGLPVIATDAGGTSEIIDDGVNGFIIPIECDGKIIANKIIDVLGMDQEDYDKLSSNAIKIWDERCNAEKLYTSFANELLLQSVNKK